MRCSVGARKRDAADKGLIVDMFDFVISQMEELETVELDEGDVGVMLVSNDGDFCHAMEALTKRNVFTVLLHTVQVSQVMEDCVCETLEWTDVVRGTLAGRTGKAVAAVKEEAILEAVKLLLVDGFYPTVANIRASLRLDGRGNQAAWEAVRETVEEHSRKGSESVQYMIGSQFYDTRNPSLEYFDDTELAELYHFLRAYPLVRKNGQYLMAKFMRETAQDTLRYPSIESMPLAKICAFVRLALTLGWITARGSIMTIHESLLDLPPARDTLETALSLLGDHEDEEEGEADAEPHHRRSLHRMAHTEESTSVRRTSSSHSLPFRNHPASPAGRPSPPSPVSLPSPFQQEQAPKVSPARSGKHASGSLNAERPKPVRVPMEQAKGLLQYYFQKERLGLPEYETKSAGTDHCLTWKATVCVPLVDAFEGQKFFASGRDVKKRDAEKYAAQKACETLFNSYLIHYKVPAQYS